MEKTVLLVDQAYEDIKNMICNFELIPGQIVSDFTFIFISYRGSGIYHSLIKQSVHSTEDTADRCSGNIGADAYAVSCFSSTLVY